MPLRAVNCNFDSSSIVGTRNAAFASARPRRRHVLPSRSGGIVSPNFRHGDETELIEPLESASSSSDENCCSDKMASVSVGFVATASCSDDGGVGGCAAAPGSSALSFASASSQPPAGGSAAAARVTPGCLRLLLWLCRRARRPRPSLSSATRARPPPSARGFFAPWPRPRGAARFMLFSCRPASACARLGAGVADGTCLLQFLAMAQAHAAAAASAAVRDALDEVVRSARSTPEPASPSNSSRPA